ncbi:hypothetical protein SRHO_G00031670 [Serrasalmus rhombeus]
MEEKQKAAERQAEEFIKELEQEITELKRRDTELEQLSHTEDHLHLLQVYPSLCSPPPTKNWTDVRINTHLRVETLRRALSRLQEELSKEMEKVVEEGFSSVRFYYEVQVSWKTNWDLGVTTESSKRKGEIILSPEDGYWTVWLTNETKYEAVESTCVPLSLKQAPQKVGVFVDYEEGLVSFYDVKSRSHIYSFTGQSFTEKLYPYFSPCGKDGARMSFLPQLLLNLDRTEARDSSISSSLQVRVRASGLVGVFSGLRSTFQEPKRMASLHSHTESKAEGASNGNYSTKTKLLD